MFFKKILIILAMATLLLGGVCIPSYAEDTVEVPEATDTTTPTAYEEFVAKVEAYASTGYEPTIVYTSDSVHSHGVLLDPYIDTLKFEMGCNISVDLPMGIVVYDDPTTNIIEGIRVNGAEITSYAFPVDLDNPQTYIVEVRLVYADGLTGTLAKISNGEFDFKTIFEEPLLALQAGYYILAAFSLIVGGLGMASSKKKKIKSAEDIANLVAVRAESISTQADLKLEEARANMLEQCTYFLENSLLPVFNTIVDANKTVTKAIALSNSKSKEAPIALLDTLKNVSDIDTEKVIEDAKQEFLKHMADADEKRNQMRQILANIAQGTYQEVHHAETDTPKPEQEPVPKNTEPDEPQSVF